MNPFFASHTTQQRSEKNGPHVCFFTVVQRIPKIVKMINDIKTNSLEHHLKIFTFYQNCTLFLVGYLVKVNVSMAMFEQKVCYFIKKKSRMIAMKTINMKIVLDISTENKFVTGF